MLKNQDFSAALEALGLAGGLEDDINPGGSLDFGSDEWYEALYEAIRKSNAVGHVAAYQRDEQRVIDGDEDLYLTDGDTAVFDVGGRKYEATIDHPEICGWWSYYALTRGQNKLIATPYPATYPRRIYPRETKPLYTFSHERLWVKNVTIDPFSGGALFGDSWWDASCTLVNMGAKLRVHYRDPSATFDEYTFSALEEKLIPPPPSYTDGGNTCYPGYEDFTFELVGGVGGYDIEDMAPTFWIIAFQEDEVPTTLPLITS